MTDPRGCSLCGRALPGPRRAEAGPDEYVAADLSAATAGWLRETADAGMVTWVCPACVRRHIRSIEARLDGTWW